MNVQIILPERATDGLSEGLRTLTSAIYAAMPELERGYGLGGPNGYGADFENDVFMMHHYCWCDSPDCPWCAGCDCDVGADGECDWCRGVHKWADKGALPPNERPSLGAPHFWHKLSGLRVWWYKYIGRGMEIVGPSDADVAAILAQCIRSLRPDGTRTERDL